MEKSRNRAHCSAFRSTKPLFHSSLVTNSHVPLMRRQEEEEGGVAHPQKGRGRSRCKPKGGKAKRSSFLPRWPWFKSCHGLMISLQAPLTCFFPSFFLFSNVVRLSFLSFPFSFRTNVEREEGGREDVDITFRYSFLRRVIIVA